MNLYMCRISALMYALTLTQHVAPPDVRACYTFQYVCLRLNAQV